MGEGDIHAIFYESQPWEGRPTRVFAYYGIPVHAVKGRTPAMVLVHGGGGSAFIRWVRLWMDRGYAAIAMDTCGCISSSGFMDHPRHEAGGPPGWGGFDQIDQPWFDQWTYHAVSDVILAHSLIRSFPAVNPEKIGVTGISWGGYLTCIAAGLDSRFKFAAPVYGCGFLGDNSTWLDQFKTMGTERARRWLNIWDPSRYLPFAHMPFLWVTGTNDFAYPMDSLQQSYRLPRNDRTLCVRVRMPHGHGIPGENPEEIRVFADSMLADGPRLARITGTRRQRARVEAFYDSPVAIVRAELNYTCDRGKWMDRSWATVPAVLDHAAGRVWAELPAGVSVYYFNLVDARDCVVSSEHEMLDA
jgi:pimeloyl-ACP methyl ester carboxylesterase